MAQLLFWGGAVAGALQATFVCADGHVVAYNIQEAEKEAFAARLNTWRDTLEDHPPKKEQVQKWLVDQGFIDAKLPHNIPSYTMPLESPGGDSVAEMDQADLVQLANELGVADAEKLDRGPLVQAVQDKLAANAQAEASEEGK